MSFEAMNDAGVVWLHMRGEIGFAVFNTNVGEYVWLDMSRAVILEQQGVSFLLPQLLVPHKKPFLLEFRCHP